MVIYDEDCGCLVCGFDDENRLLCKSCRDTIKESNILTIIDKEGFQLKCYSSGYYSGIVKEMILRFKYKSDFRCGEALSELMLEVIRRNNLKFDLVTFVPSSKKAMKKRGYNQSKFLAKLISNRTEKVMIDLLKKTSETRDQIGLDGENRWKNLKECFAADNCKDIYNKKILLIDDVMTTGATAFYCAKELLKNKAGEIIILTIAKSKI